MLSEGSHVTVGEPSCPQQFVWHGFNAMCQKFDVVQQREGRPGRGMVNAVRIPVSPGDSRGFGRHWIRCESGPSQAPCHLPRNDHRLGIQRPQQLVAEEALDR